MRGKRASEPFDFKLICISLKDGAFKWEKSMTLKKLAEDALEREQYTTAYHFALCALSSRFSLKWAFYTLILWLKSKPKLG